MKQNIIHTHPVTKKETILPETIELKNGQILSFSRGKTAGWTAGAWYKNKEGEEFLVKTGGAFCYSEKLLNDLAQIAIDEKEPQGTEIGHGLVNGKNESCIILKKIPNYADLATIEETLDGIEERKNHAKKFHNSYVFEALIANDDLNEENLGLINNNDALIIDYGLMPRFLHKEQIEFAHIPFTLASLIGHRNLNGMQLVRRRYFGHDDFLLPDSLKTKASFKEEDIKYSSILLGIEKYTKKSG